VKNEFKKLGAIHAHNSSVHSIKTKRDRMSTSEHEVDLVDSDDEPFTLKTAKKSGIKKHEIIVKHEHPSPSESSLRTDLASRSSSLSLTKPQKLSVENEIFAKVNIILIFIYIDITLIYIVY
jgi:ABC-type molybdate transport system ATPase subunit